MKTKNKISFITWDWKETPVKEIAYMCKKFGLYLYTDPYMEGTDDYGYIVSSEKLDKNQINKLSRKKWGVSKKDWAEMMGELNEG